jgi:hypothetical protein
MPLTGFDDIFNNIKKITGGKNQKEVAKKLGMSAQAVSDAKTRNAIPDGWFEILQKKYNMTKEEICESPEEKAEKMVRASSLQLNEPQGTDQNLKGINEADILGREFKNLCAACFDPVFEYIAEVYGKDSVGISNFLDDLRDVHHGYRVWRFEKKHERESSSSGDGKEKLSIKRKQ